MPTERGVRVKLTSSNGNDVGTGGRPARLPNAVVTHGSNHHHAMVRGVLKGISQPFGGDVPRPERQAHVDEVRAMVNRVVKALDQAILVVPIGFVQDFDGHQSCARGQPLDRVVSCDDAGDVGAVATVVVGPRVVVDEVVRTVDGRGRERRSLRVGHAQSGGRLIGHTRVKHRHHVVASVRDGGRRDHVEVPLHANGAPGRRIPLGERSA